MRISQEGIILHMTHLVIGSGLLGRAIINALLAHDIPVRVLDLQGYDNPDTHNLTGDIRDRDIVRAACQDVDTVFHTVAHVSTMLGKSNQMYSVNVDGTQHVIDACREQGVKQLVYTSSVDVVYDGSPIRNGDESLAYPQRHLDYYGETKMLAEKRILAADSDDLHTVSLRVAGLYGPHDRQRFPPIIDLALEGSFVRIGDGKAKFNHLYVENAVHAHLLAADALRHPDSPLRGAAYFITDYEATNFFDFVEHYILALDLPVRVRRLPQPIAELIARGYELRYRLFSQESFASPLITRYVVSATCNDFWFSHLKATQDFGYQPGVTLDEAEARTLSWLRSYIELLRKNRH